MAKLASPLYKKYRIANLSGLPGGWVILKDGAEWSRYFRTKNAAQTARRNIVSSLEHDSMVNLYRRKNTEGIPVVDSNRGSAEAVPDWLLRFRSMNSDQQMDFIFALQAHLATIYEQGAGSRPDPAEEFATPEAPKKRSPRVTQAKECRLRGGAETDPRMADAFATGAPATAIAGEVLAVAGEKVSSLTDPVPDISASKTAPQSETAAVADPRVGGHCKSRDAAEDCHREEWNLDFFSLTKAERTLLAKLLRDLSAAIYDKATPERTVLLAASERWRDYEAAQRFPFEELDFRDEAERADHKVGEAESEIVRAKLAVSAVQNEEEVDTNNGEDASDETA